MNFTPESQLSQPSTPHGSMVGWGTRCFKAYLRCGTKNRHICNTCKLMHLHNLNVGVASLTGTSAQVALQASPLLM